MRNPGMLENVLQGQGLIRVWIMKLMHNGVYDSRGTGP